MITWIWLAIEILVVVAATLWEVEKDHGIGASQNVADERKNTC